MLSISLTIVQLNEHNVELSIHCTTSVDHSVYIQLLENMSLLNEFMCGPLDIQDIKGETDVEAEHGTGSLPDRLINPKEYEPAVLTKKEHRAAELTDTISDPRKLTPVFTYGSLQLCKCS